MALSVSLRSRLNTRRIGGLLLGRATKENTKAIMLRALSAQPRYVLGTSLAGFFLAIFLSYAMYAAPAAGQQLRGTPGAATAIEFPNSRVLPQPAFGKAASRAGTSSFGMAETMIAGGFGSLGAVRFMRFPFSWGSHNGAGGPESVVEFLHSLLALVLPAPPRGYTAAVTRGRGCRRPRGGGVGGGDRVRHAQLICAFPLLARQVIALRGSLANRKVSAGKSPDDICRGRDRVLQITSRSFGRRRRRGSPAGEARDDRPRDPFRHIDDEQYQQNAVNGTIQTMDIMPERNA